MIKRNGSSCLTMQHGDMNSVKAFCEEAISASGYPHMKKLGRDMMDMLGQKG